MHRTLRFLARSALVALSLAAAACGGPLSHNATFDPSAVGDAKRAELGKRDAAVEQAATKRDAAKANAESAASAVDAAEAALEQREADLEVAEASLDLEETKEGAKRDHDVAGAEKTKAAKQAAVKVAEAELEVARKKADVADAEATEAEELWVVALAERELARHDAMPGEGPARTEEQAKLEKQLAEAKAAAAEAKESRAQAQQDLEEAEESLAAAKKG